MNRRKILWIRESRIADLFRKHCSSSVVFRWTQSGIPDTANLIFCYYSPERACFGFVFEDESFDPVPEGEEYPTFIQSMVSFVDLKNEHA